MRALIQPAALFLAVVSFVALADLLLRSYMTRAIRGLAALGRRVFSRGAHYVVLGCTRYGHRIYAFAEDLVIVWPPRAGNPPDRILGHQSVSAASTTRLPGPGEGGEGGEPS